ncbi:hypothetical protein MCAG_03846 [Micromonospora sp. ATCC 39149]|uniref:hypothetical protein n=1 Tax=Micromonospora sp. (strain ATCC 39149 / NRRL 15099 / SCC 1413) TaxID=219305 RepID=UPI0001A50587|nr:hypothetical protein [Micromonospora sp. ATCC 39149]EEP73519.1 hypothetical protein MCAG_03846 [Micromonospora sp. ATCC 39149]
MTPHHLHALAAAYAVRDARTRLGQLATLDHRRAVDHHLQAAALLRSPTYGTRTSIGGHGDPTGGALLTAHPTRDTTWADLYRRSTDRLDWLASTLRCDHGPTVGRILTAIPTLSPGTARIVAQHLTDEDAWVRAAVRLAPAREPLPGVACPNPRCGQRLLEVLTAGPVDCWTVRCQVCLCIGAGCGCGMPGAVEGVAHIWPRASVLGAVAGASAG